MKKSLLIFIIIGVIIIVAGIAYNTYCTSKSKECKDEPYDTRNLSDDHMDASF